MTVEAIARKAGPYQYTAGASYPFYYKVFSAEDVAVYVVQDSSEVQLTEDQYTVNLNDDQDNNPGGTVAVSVICESITIVSDVDYTQETVITNRGGFYPDVLNKIHDKLTILIQQILTTLNRTVKIKVTDATSDPDKILDDLRTTASAAAESAAISVSAAQASADSAATAIATANTAVAKSETAIATADTANATATQALSSIPSTVAETVNTTISGMDIPRLVSDDVDNKIDSLNLDEKIASEVKDAIAGTEIPGLTPETIAGALGYTPYDAETNNKDFATSEEVGQAIQQAVDAIPEQVNADWNATSGIAEILNKPTAMTGATAETAGKQGFVPAPSAGDQNKVLTGSGEWKHASGVPIGFIGYYGATTPPAGFLKCDGAAVGRATYPELYAVIGTTYGEGDGETTFNLPDLIGRFAEGSATPGTVKEAGLPNIKGVSNIGGNASKSALAGGALKQVRYQKNWILNGAASDINDLAEVELDASLYNPIYGKSDTVQPPALTLLPCIKAFDAAIDSGLIDITELANEVAGKADKTQVANLAMPSDSAVALTIPSSGSSITAPADGYVNFTGTAGDQAGYVNLYSETTGSMVSMPAGYSGKALLPVREGVIVHITYVNLNTSTLYFVYAEGSQP